LKCGAGSYCHVGGLWKYVIKEDEDKLKDFEFTDDKFKRWEDDPGIPAEVEKYGRELCML